MGSVAILTSEKKIDNFFSIEIFLEKTIKMSTKTKKSLCYIKIRSNSCCAWYEGSLRKKIFASKKHDFWLLPPTNHIKKSEFEKKNCVLVCFFCMTVKQKNERKIFAPHYKNGLNKKLIIKDLKKCKVPFWFLFPPLIIAYR
jgi:hypothetical protein